MGLEVNIRGLTELKARLEALAGDEATRAGQAAVRAGGRVALNAIRAETPVSDVEEGHQVAFTRKSGGSGHYAHKKIKNAPKVKKIRPGKSTQVGVAVTAGKAFQARFVEWGTIHQSANPFMSRAVEHAQQPIIDRMAVILERQIVRREKSAGDE